MTSGERLAVECYTSQSWANSIYKFSCDLAKHLTYLLPLPSFLGIPIHQRPFSEVNSQFW